MGLKTRRYFYLFLKTFTVTIIKHTNQRVGVFIDTQNLYHSGKNLYGKNVNFESLIKSVVDGRELVRAIAYTITTESDDESLFHDALVKMGIETRSKDLQIFSGGEKKADWDVGLAIDAITLSGKLDVITICSGDGDFIPLVRYLKMQGCQVEVASFIQSSSSRLVEEADDFLDLSKNTKKFLIGSRK